MELWGVALDKMGHADGLFLTIINIRYSASNPILILSA